MSDPVSWFVVEKGWKVVGSDGEHVGTVDELVGDTGNDIFNGLKVSVSLLGSPRYVPAERVAEIVEGEIRLDVPASEAKDLDDYDEPGESLEIRP